MKRLFFTLLACLAVTLASATIEDGKVYAIVMTTDTTKALFVKDASLSAGADVNVWTNTHVPAQLWEAVKGTSGNTYSFRNLYTGYYLSYNGSGTAGAKLIQAGGLNTRSRWLLRAVDASNNIYRLRISGLTLQADGTTDGGQPKLQNNNASDNSQEWQLVEVENPVREFNAQVRSEMMDGFLKQYVQVRSGSMFSFVNGGWSDAEMMEVILDAYEETHDPAYKTFFQKAYAYFKQGVGDNWTGGGRNGYDWFGYDFNDDVAWMLIAASRAYHLFGDQTCLNDAKRNFDLIYQRAYMPSVGLVRWAERSGLGDDGSISINSCVNGPMEVAACYIAEGTGDESYYEKARDIYAQQRVKLANMTTGQVYDSYRVDASGNPTGSRNNWASTYNQGTMMGGAVLLYRHYKDAQYKQDAERIMEYTVNNMCDANGIIKVCQVVDGDLCGFKGILMRYVRRLVVDCGDTQYTDWLKKNAFQAYNNRNSIGVSSSAWLSKTTENLRQGNENYSDKPFGCSTAVAAAFSVPLGVTDSLGRDTTAAVTSIEAEFATLSNGCTITRDRYSSNGMYVAGVGNGRTLSFDYEAPEDGVYDITVYYMSPNGRYMYVTTTGAPQTTQRYRLTGSDNAKAQGTMTVQLTLKKGVNRITMGNRTGQCPNLDRFEIAFNPTATGIGGITVRPAKAGDDAWYDLQGRRVDERDLGRGVYIHQGKKIVRR